MQEMLENRCSMYGVARYVTAYYDAKYQTSEGG